MKNIRQKEETGDKKRYVFFSDPDIIVKRAETSAVAAQIRRDFETQWQVHEKQSTNLPASKLGINSFENFLSYRPVQSYPFSFINALKQKLALTDHSDIGIKTYNTSSQAGNSLTSSVLKANCNQLVGRMDYIRLKAPDLKISPKTLDFSNREYSVSKELSSEIVAKEFVHDRFDKAIKVGERVQRKLDFSSSNATSISCENVEPLKAPNVSISASNLSKKKDHIRDSSREKENRSKRIKKDDSGKKDESVQEQTKRSKSPRHISRKDTVDTTSNITRVKNDRVPFHATKNNDSLPTKSRAKNFVTSTTKKDDRRQRSFNMQPVELTKDIPPEFKSRMCSNKGLEFLPFKVPDKVATRDNSSMAISSNNTDNKSKDISHSKQVEDLKYKCDSDRQLKHEKLNFKDQTKKISDKNKILKTEGKMHNVNSELSEDIEYTSESNGSKNMVVHPGNFIQQLKSKDPEMKENKQSVNSVRSAKTSENFKYTERSAIQSSSTSTKKEESYSQSIITTKQTTTSDGSNDVDTNTLPETLFDPRRISFRDSSYSQQEEFHNLTTPEKMDVTLKSKQRRCLMQSSNLEMDTRYPTYKPTIKSEQEEENIQLMHPTALHMQFQAELHLLDTFSKSLKHISDVEKCLYNTKCEPEQKNTEEKNRESEKIQVGEIQPSTAADNDVAGKTTWKSLGCLEKDAETRKPDTCSEMHVSREYYVTNRGDSDESGKSSKAEVKVAEVQTQTVNDIATQTDKFLEEDEDLPQSLLDSVRLGSEDLIEEMSLPSRIRTVSEISLHEISTSSIKSIETGTTEISISTRDVTCLFNKYLYLEIAQLLKDEKQRYNKFEMMFKSREKTLHDRTKKLAKLEEQKKALKDTGQDSRSLRKKQRALVLRLKKEQDEIKRLKELNKIASQQRKLVLEKQWNIFNDMSTKNILTKLKRSADSQSPRRLSGPMKGYDIRSNSSVSSLIDTDKSQHDGSQVDARLQASENDTHLSKFDYVKFDKFINLAEESNTSATKFDDLVENNEILEKNILKSQKKSMSKYELNSRKYEDKMPGADILRLKQSQLDIESKRIQGSPMKIKRFLENQKPIEISQSSKTELDVLVPDYVKSECDMSVKELSKRLRTSQVIHSPVRVATDAKEKESVSNMVITTGEPTEKEVNLKTQDTISKTTKLSQVPEDIEKIDKCIVSDRDISRKSHHSTELSTSSKRKSSKYQKTKSSLTENILRSKSSSHILEELIKYHDKRTKLENELLQLDDNNESSILSELDLNGSQSSFQALIRHSKAVKEKNSKLLNEINDYESKENVASQVLNKKLENDESLSRNKRVIQNIPASQISTFAISHLSSEESEKNFSKSIVVRSQDRHFKASEKLEQILTARETALASRKNCVEEWMAWHRRLRAEEDRIARMEQAALKLVAATPSVLSQQERGMCSFIDTTISSDTTDVEGRIGILTEKLAQRRIEMSRLKREARKQAKQKLRALEANLLNQIQKYDTTIHEMRKKLESKKAIKDNDKLAIESKSLADFKVPDIPLKRIQDIYKNSDLLRSRSESDLLLSTRNQQRDLSKFVTSIIYDDKHEKNDSRKSIRSGDIKNINDSELKSATHSTQSIFDEYTLTETRDKHRTATSVSLNDVRSEKYAVSALDTDRMQLEGSTEMKQNSALRDAEDIQTVTSTVRSESEIQTISDAKSSEDHGTINTESLDDKLIAHTSNNQSESNIPTIQSENVDSRSVSSKSNHADSAAPVTVATSNHDIFNLSKKLDFLQLNNKTLNEDISSLENGIKALSEMVSRLSDKANDKFKVHNDERSTSQDISEIISKSVFSDKIINIKNEEKKIVSPEKKIDTESLSTSMNDRKSKSSDILSHSKYVSERISSQASSIIPEEIPAVSNSAHEIDYEAKSKEIMNEIEKSIISEHIKMARGDYNVSSVLENDMQNLCKNNEELLNDLVSLELDIKSRISDNSATPITDSKEDTNVQSDINEANSEEHVKNEISTTQSSKLSERFSAKSIHSPVIAGHRLKENYEINSQDDSRRTDSAISNQNAHVVVSENSKSLKDTRSKDKALNSRTVVDNKGISRSFKHDEDVQAMLPDDTVNSAILTINTDQNHSHATSVENILDKDDWTTSDSFEVPQNEISTGGGANVDFKNSKSYSDRINDISNNFSNEKNASLSESIANQKIETNILSEIEISAFIPKGESTEIEMQDVTFANAIVESNTTKSRDELDDILDIIARENNQKESISNNESGKFDTTLVESVTDLLDKTKDKMEDNRENVDNLHKGNLRNNKIDVFVDNRSEAISYVSMVDDETENKINLENKKENDVVSANIINNNESGHYEEVIDTSLGAIDKANDKSTININLHVEIDNEESLHEIISEAQEIIITELDSDSIEDHTLPELEIDAKVELAEDGDTDDANDRINNSVEKTKRLVPIEIYECLEPILEQDSSDGEQLDNLVEVVESKLDMVEKLTPSSQLSVREAAKNDEEISTQAEEALEETTGNINNADTSRNKRNDETAISDASMTDYLPNINKTFDILKDPDYEDISEESLEVSEILDKNEFPKVTSAKKSASLPEKYQATQKSEEVLRILDEISQKSSPDSIISSQKDEKNVHSVTEEISELLEVSAGDNISSPEINKIMRDKIGEESHKTSERKNQSLEEAMLQKKQSVEVASDTGLVEEKSNEISPRLDEGLYDDKSSQIIYELRERVSRLQEQDGSSESSEAGDTPRGVSEIEMDSPRDFNDSRLDIDILDDDLLSNTKAANQGVDVKTNFHSASIVATSENDIEAMINKIKASLEQPGLEVSELEAKLLRIEQLQIELEIKKLEAEEVSYYIREIPNKPPPPYTPPGDSRLSTSLDSPSLLTAVIPSNVEELTSFTEKATVLIYNAKLAGADIMSLETPSEIYELSKEKNEIVRKDRRIYNTFLFDLCKETIADVYRAEYEKPGPSWTKPNVKTKPTMKIPKTVEELTEYVNKEVATLFGFKTKLQRENMVMRWSRKRRDRVDELLAREAQAEEDEWTKFHHDELAVKNGLTVAILDSLVMETANVVKIAYGKKRRMMV